MEMRRIIYRHCTEIQRIEVGEIECDESYFGPRRVKGKRGRGAGGKTIVFGLFKRNGKVYTHIAPNAKAETLLPLLRRRPRARAVHPKAVPSVRPSGHNNPATNGTSDLVAAKTSAESSAQAATTAKSRMLHSHMLPSAVRFWGYRYC
jgi:hypothetical protein